MTGAEAINYIGSVSWLGSRPGLARTEELLERMGNPHQKLKFVHIAGTNGKGSTASMVASVLQRAGLKTGLYTSPFLERFHERMQINGVPIADARLGQVTKFVASCASEMEDSPTEFELVTAIAFQWYLEEGCDMVVLETGLGGRLDSTNVIPSPEVAVITAIGLDHIAQLGDTLTAISGEKAAIIKEGCTAVLYQHPPEVAQVFYNRCTAVDATVVQADFEKITVRQDDLHGQTFDYGTFKNLFITLLGNHQRHNAAVAVDTILALRHRGYAIDDHALYQGLAAAKWPGRFELLEREPPLVVDGGHNVQGANALKTSLEQYFPQKSVVFILGVLKDKDFDGVIDQIVPMAKGFFTVTPDSPRALPAEALAKILADRGHCAQSCDSVATAVAGARAMATDQDVICAFGSLYMTGQVRTHILQRQR